MSKRILHLTLKKKWFDLIASGSKTTEYREIKDYWKKRLVTITDKRIMCPNFIGHPFTFNEFDEVHFRNGYSKNSPFMEVEYRKTKLEVFEGKMCFAIRLGEILSIKNYSLTKAYRKSSRGNDK